MKRVLSLAIIGLVVSGCGSQLGPGNSVTASVASKHSSEATFRNLLAVAKDCYPDAITIRSNYFPEAKEGEIELLSVNDFGNRQFATFLVKPAASGSVVTMTRMARHKSYDEALPEWINGNARLCPIGTRSEPRPPGSDLNQNNMPVR